MFDVIDERTRIMSFQDGCSPLVAFTGLAAAFLVLVTVFFAFGEESGEDKSDDMAILQLIWMRGNLGYSDGRRKWSTRSLRFPFYLDATQSHVEHVCVFVCSGTHVM